MKLTAVAQWRTTSGRSQAAPGPEAG
jgi:hypothetical protein